MRTLPEHLQNLRDLWISIVRGPRRRATIAGVCLVFTLAMLVARVGTLRARAVAGVILALAVIAVVLLRVWDRRVLGDPARTIRRVAAGATPELAARAVRALSLVGGDLRGTSSELAEMHVKRTLSALPEEGVTRSASRLAMILGAVALGVAATNVAACATNPWGPVEGIDVLIAKGGVAPIGMTWLEATQVRARPPDYLHEEERSVYPHSEVSLPYGTLMTVRGTPVHPNRRLLLTDGDDEVPFVDDGSGHVVARWPIAGTVKLRVVARFGDVVVPEAMDLAVESIPDLAPKVVLAGAPKRIVLGKEEDSDIPIDYDAIDDHGLREVHLVLRAGAREERRVLARLDGETKRDRGGHRIHVSDPFIKKSHAPIEIRVEAKDNDPLTGPKWGASEAILVVPPEVGEPEARRLEALVAVRDKLVDALAWRLANGIPADMKERKEHLEHEAKLADEDLEALETALTTSFAGVRVRPKLAAMLRGRMRKLGEAVMNQGRSPSSAAHATVVKANERMVLVVDAVIQGSGLGDTRAVAKELAEVADDLALAATIAQKPAEKIRGEQRMDGAAMVLDGGGHSLRRLGLLGRDIGEIVAVDLGRVARARQAQDLPHAALAAQDLALRLHTPDASFSAKGGRPSHAGGESGGGRGSPGDGAEEGEGSDVAEAFNEAVQDLDKLAGDHANELGKVEQAIAGGASPEDIKALADEAKKHAQNVRDYAKPLPSVGGGSDSWSSKAAAAREHAEQMARALEEGNAADAVQGGREAVAELDDAKRAAARDRFGRLGDTQAERTSEEARRGIDKELKWAEQKLDELRKKAAQRAGSELRDHGTEEGKLADRARDVEGKGREQGLPQEALEALEGAQRAAREASQALQQGDAEKGLQKQREAQAKLEQAREAAGADGEGEGKGHSDRDGEQGDPDGKADIPKADQHKGPEEFRRRVIKGLGQPSGGRYKDAVKRYAEGLLR